MLRTNAALLVVVCLLAACSAEPEPGTGVVSLPLVATGSAGNVYRLNPARFRFTGPGTNRVVDGSDVDVLNVDLVPGDYLIQLQADWQLQIRGADGTFTNVPAVLQSANPQGFQIVEQQVTNIVFRFGVGPEAITFGNGRASVTIMVNEGCTPAPEICNGMDDDCDGVVDDGNVCSKRVFVTRGAVTGAMGGLTGADMICQISAQSEGLGGTWVAWLSDGTTAAPSRLTPNSGPFVRVDGAVVANSIADLLDGSIASPINVNENGEVAPVSLIWTGTHADGTPAPDNCLGWTSATVFGGEIGQDNLSNGGWTDTGGLVCSFPVPLYCFER